MTVPTNEARRVFTGNGVSNVFDFPFPYLSPNDIKVIEQTVSSGAESLLAAGGGYVLTPASGGGPGGRVTTTSPIANGHRLAIIRDPVPVQETDLVENDKFFANTIERAFDLLTMVQQRQSDQIVRALVLREADIPGSGAYGASSNRIANLGAGIDPTDAVTLAQLDARLGAVVTNPVLNNPALLQQITDQVLASTQLLGLFTPLNTSVGNLALRVTSAETSIASLSQIAGDPANIVALINTETSARIQGDALIATTVSRLGALAADGQSFIIDQNTARLSPSESLAQRFAGLAALISNANAAVTTESTARAAADSALASSVTTVQANINQNTTTLQTQATVIDGIQGKFSVKIDVNGFVTGFGLISTANNGAAVSQFTVLADRFAVVTPGQVPRVPFVAGIINGVPGVGISGSLLVDGTVTATALQARTITADRIVAGALTATELADLAVTGAKLANASITGSKIVAGSIDASRLSVTQLSAITADLGTMTGGLIRLTSGSFRLELGVDSGYIQWFGSGVKNDANANFWIKPDGTAFFRGVIGSGTTLPIPPAFSLSIPAGAQTAFVANGAATWGSVTATPSGGRAPYSYLWAVTQSSATGLQNTPIIPTTPNTAAVGFNSVGNDVVGTGNATCIVSDADGRVAFATISLTVTHGTPP